VSIAATQNASLIFPVDSGQVRVGVSMPDAWPAWAAAFAGTWEANFQGQVSVDLKADRTNLTGTIKAGAGTNQIFDGRIDGTTMTFKIKTPNGDRPITFTGTVTGNERVK
jgi:hypothetical protein